MAESLGNNLDTGNSCGFNQVSDLVNVEAGLGPLQDNGGFSPTHALLSYSRAIDAGSNTSCPATDQRGVARPIDGIGQGTARCDVGAFEYQPPPFAVTRTPTPTPTFTPTLTPTPTATATPVDTAAPTITSFTINSGALATTSATVNISLAATDNWSGLAEMSFSNDGTTWGAWQAYATTASHTLAAGDGPKTVSARVRDRRGNVSQVVTAQITLDAAAGADYGVTLNQGALFTNTVDVTLTIGARQGATQMQVSNDGGFAGAQWEPYNSRKSWQVTQFGNSVIPRTAYVKYKDLAGAISSVYQDDIILDVTPPTGSVTIGQAAGAAASGAARDAAATVSLAAQDDASGVADMRLANRADFTGAQWEPFATTRAWTFDSANRVYVQFRDRAGNVSQTYSTAGPAATPTATSTPQVSVTATSTPQTSPTATRTQQVPPTATSTPQTPATATSTPQTTAATRTLPPTPSAPACAPRPSVTVAAVPAGNGTLQVTVGADTAANARLLTLRFGAGTNALIDVGSQTGLRGDTTVTLPVGTQQTTFTVRRATAGQAATVPLVVTDSCGDWPTFVGGGPSAF